ncbi:MAG: indolepyruvate ferredoxin oxidoreductase [Treponema sp.]|jgi:indolepyruvate ferredoxin oxidoreductase alpha subunit|nr:indolepyruvate ferredoxin oxidoreductase [Treponema sp.]
METIERKALLGDEAVATAALHAGVSAAYGYPGTPSTEILEYLIDEYERRGGPRAAWCANEKTAVEAGLGVSFAGRRAIVTMKHVGLNVAADPFINGALLGIKGGLVIAVADDPGMHSSQNEQDSRFYAAFALIPCLEPRSQQEAYDFTREAFDISEWFHTPVLLRLTTRLSHARAEISFKKVSKEGVEAETREGIRAQNPLSKVEDCAEWMLLPAFARKNYANLIAKQEDILEWSNSHAKIIKGNDESLAIITAGLGGNYYDENVADFTAMRNGKMPSRLHISTYPLPVKAIRELCEKTERVLVIEEGQPFIEEKLRGILSQKVSVFGKLQGLGDAPSLPRTGELDPDNVRAALGLAPRPSILASLNTNALQDALEKIPTRPPQLCQGCPHGDSYEAIKRAIVGLDSVAITSDIGCYSLGVGPPYLMPETIVCMGASVGMARGAADAGLKYVVAVIGDSTFLHSGMTGLLDAVAANTPMTLIILDNSIVAMTGCQETIVPSEKFQALLLGLGVPPEHLLELEAKHQLLDENVAKLHVEIEYQGLSVVIFKRPCLEALRKWKRNGGK